MKKTMFIKNYTLLLLSVLLFSTLQSAFSQTKKSTTRLKLQYHKVMDQKIYFEITAGARVDRKNVDVTDIRVDLFNIVHDEDILIGSIKTDLNGEGTVVVNPNRPLRADSTNVYTVKAVFKGNDAFKKATKSLSFMDADVNAKLVVIDSVNYISATFIDKATELPIENEALGVQVDRLFMPLQIEEFVVTDENGTILVPIEEGIPGIDGKLNIEVVLNDHDDYGNIKSIVVAPIGKPIVDESTFDERTMFSPRNKTPLFLLIFSNLIIIGMWGLIFYLCANLWKIAKS